MLVPDWEDPGFEGKPGDAWVALFFHELSRQVPRAPAGRQWLYRMARTWRGRSRRPGPSVLARRLPPPPIRLDRPGAGARPHLVAGATSTASPTARKAQKARERAAHSLPGIGRCDINRWTSGRP